MGNIARPGSRPAGISRCRGREPGPDGPVGPFRWRPVPSAPAEISAASRGRWRARRRGAGAHLLRPAPPVVFSASFSLSELFRIQPGELLQLYIPI